MLKPPVLPLQESPITRAALKASIREGQSKREKLNNTHKFFSDLPEHERRLFAIVTEDIPLNSTAGLQTIRKRLWEGRERSLLFEFALRICQISLNCYTVLSLAASMAWGKPQYSDDTHSGSHGVLKVCSTRLKPHCFETALSQWLVLQIFCFFEAGVLLCMCSYTLICSLCITMRADPGEFVGRHYFGYLGIPRLTAKFSFIMFLHWANAERLKAFIVSGEFRCLASLYGSTLRRRVVGVVVPVDPMLPIGMQQHVLPKESQGTLWHIAGFMFWAALFGVGIYALLLKLMLMYFAALFPISEWTPREALLFLGFVNQLSGISLSTEIQMLRILLFKFGGQETRWNSAQIEACTTYFRYFTARSVEQLGPRRALCLLWTMNSADLQKLFQGNQRFLQQVIARDAEVEMFLRLDSREQLVNLRDQLLKSFGNMNAQLDETLETTDPEDRVTLLNRLQVKAIGELRLAAQVQEHIWEWTKVDMLEAGATVSHIVSDREIAACVTGSNRSSDFCRKLDMAVASANIIS